MATKKVTQQVESTQVEQPQEETVNVKTNVPTMAQAAKEVEKAAKKLRRVTVHYNDPRDSHLVTSAYANCDNAYFFPPVGVAIVAAGTIVAVAGVLLDIEWMTMVGAAMGLSAGSDGGSIGSAISSAVTSPMTYVSIALQIGINMYGNSLEAKIKGMQNELKEMEENWEKEVDSRVNPLGGIGKTSSGGDEDFDNFYALMDQDYLAQSLFLASDVEMSSPVFNESKYDNTRKV